MSWIRPLDKPGFSRARAVYAFPMEHEGKDYIWLNALLIPSEDFCEVMCIILTWAGIKLNLKKLNKIRKIMYLKPLKKYSEEAKEEWLYQHSKSEQIRDKIVEKYFARIDRILKKGRSKERSNSHSKKGQWPKAEKGFYES